MTIRLTDRAVIALSGPQAREFLQGLVTNDVNRVGPTTPIYAALLTPQGKVLFDFLVFDSAGGLLLDCPAGQRDALAKRLSLYRLRAKVEIVPRDDLAVVWSGDPVFALPLIRDPRRPALGYRAILPGGSISATPGNDSYLAHRLTLGVPEGADFGQDKMFALDADLDELGGVAFDKGCYVGQELTARMKHRGTARKRLLAVTAKDGVSLPESSATVFAQDRDVGTLSSRYGTTGFALVRLDRLEEAGNTPLSVDGIAIVVTKPDWLFT